MYKFCTNKSFFNVAVLKKNLSGHKNCRKIVLRCASHNVGSENLFPERVDFPSRHIGPRDQDVVTMLDLLGYKVRIYYVYYLNVTQGDDLKLCSFNLEFRSTDK